MGRTQPSPEEAIAHLLWLACIEIRHIAARGRNAATTEPEGPAKNGYERIRAIADACHNLPMLLGQSRKRVRRRAAVRQLEYLWKTATDEQLAWLHAGLDKIEYDYSNLDALRLEWTNKLRAEGLLP
ncbi:hypothetical protein NE236_05840 [Actinoallomurus purpureus]|uniref:hypothetical protein n=1 Tax=Actinoallomurus purpureus TaxID=478114 RepID=UPI002093E49A|nr:hypothetical protein [Actinoallomurus purpureus]MCO6004497.1 hypothetical protein [Actinoallomurus purpureus]